MKNYSVDWGNFLDLANFNMSDYFSTFVGSIVYFETEIVLNDFLNSKSGEDLPCSQIRPRFGLRIFALDSGRLSLHVGTLNASTSWFSFWPEPYTFELIGRKVAFSNLFCFGFTSMDRRIGDGPS